MLPRYTRQIKAFKLPRPKKFFTLLCLVKPTLCSLIPISALTYQDYAANGAGQPGGAAASQPQKTNRGWCCPVGQLGGAAANIQKKPRLVLLRRAAGWSSTHQPQTQTATGAAPSGRWGEQHPPTSNTNRDCCCSVGQLGGAAPTNLKHKPRLVLLRRAARGSSTLQPQTQTAAGAAPPGS